METNMLALRMAEDLWVEGALYLRCTKMGDGKPTTMEFGPFSRGLVIDGRGVYDGHNGGQLIAALKEGHDSSGALDSMWQITLLDGELESSPDGHCVIPKTKRIYFDSVRVMVA